VASRDCTFLTTSTMRSLVAALGNFVSAIAAIIASLISSGTLLLAQSLIALAIDLCQGVVSSVIGASSVSGTRGLVRR
jgi:hypothetical protein